MLVYFELENRQWPIEGTSHILEDQAFHNVIVRLDADESSSRGYGAGLGSQATINNTKHYETLGISKDASQADIKKAYINAAKIHHPDKGGNADKVREALSSV